MLLFHLIAAIVNHVIYSHAYDAYDSQVYDAHQQQETGSEAHRV